MGSLIVRVVAGGILAAHGAQTVFGVFGGHGIKGTADFPSGSDLPVHMPGCSV